MNKLLYFLIVNFILVINSTVAQNEAFQTFSTYNFTFPLGTYVPGDDFSSNNFSSSFGPRYLSTTKPFDFHPAIDISAPAVFTNVYSVAKGIIIGWGNEMCDRRYVVVSHLDNNNNHIFTARYRHIDFYVASPQEGDLLEQGAFLGNVTDYGPEGQERDHLHMGFTDQQKYFIKEAKLILLQR